MHDPVCQRCSSLVSSRLAAFWSIPQQSWCVISLATVHHQAPQLLFCRSMPCERLA